MARRGSPRNPVCPHGGHHRTAANGHRRGQRRYRCPGCRRGFGPTTGTVMARLQPPAPEVARALVVVLHRGSLRAAEAVTGHKDATIGRWLQRAGRHAEALTEARVHDLHLSEVEGDECWSFVPHKGGAVRRPQRPGRETPQRELVEPPHRPVPEANAGAA